METLSLIGNAFAGMMNPMSILLLIVGVAVGIVFGSILIHFLQRSTGRCSGSHIRNHSLACFARFRI